MITDSTQDKQLRRTIIDAIESYEIESLKRIVYEYRCEEMGILPDMTYYWYNQYGEEIE